MTEWLRTYIKAVLPSIGQLCSKRQVPASQTTHPEIHFTMAWSTALTMSSAFDDLLKKVFCLIFFYLVVKYTYRMFLSPLASFPGPRVAGITKLYEAYHVLLKNDWLENLVSLHDQYGPVVRIGPNELHFVDNKFNLDHHRRPDLLKCNNYYGLLDKLLGGLASPTKHAQRAAVMRPIFSGQTLAEYSKTLDKHLESLHSRLADAISNKGSVNLTHYLWAYTNDVMISYLTEENYGFLKVYDLQATHDATRAFSAIDLATVLRCMPPIKIVFDYVPALRALSPLGWLDNLMSSHVRPMVKSWDDENSHQSVLARVFNEIGNETHTVHESSQAIFIGNESLLSNLTFVLHRLIQNPECIKKIRAELDTLDIGTYGHRIWRDPKTTQLRYLVIGPSMLIHTRQNLALTLFQDAVCRESSRLSSPSWHRQPRQSDTPIEYQGAIIPPMTSVSFTLYLLERDATLFPDPNTFKPERWLNSNQDSKTTKSHSVSFGTGTRTCLGQQWVFLTI
ncbi:cytochrome P450 [Colletotrichum orchidophilum]|uniref:Cytochrome P450 n=1 Tax=Colletotrichum orchidophilum TaxID=1209926 RepID=A0A1G4B0N9_9PEZI|nr:cytochrome P450 [Colletotrichum orchidophilum]OHE94989.1 cytochrome P450 [Colletotrichum orchidophilum]